MMVFPSSTATFSSFNFKPAAPNLDDEAQQGTHIRQRKAGYKRDFDIQRTRIPSNKEITDSMLSYSQKMSEISQQRSLNASKIELPLLIKATHLPHPSRINKSQEKKRRLTKLAGGQALRAKSLPNMKLQPLLGSKRQYKISAASMVDLKNIMTVRQKPNSLNPLQSVKLDAFSSEKNVQPTNSPPENTQTENSIKVVVQAVGTQTSSATQTTDSDKSSSQHSETKPTSLIESGADGHTKLPPVTQTSTIRRLGKPRKSKRMKLHKSKLESIEEDDSDVVLTRFVGSGSSMNRLSLPSSFSGDGKVTVDFSNYQDMQQSIDDRKKDVALLRKISNSSNSNNSRLSSQLTMQALARKKLRRLPAIPNDTNNMTESPSAPVQ